MDPTIGGHVVNVEVVQIPALAITSAEEIDALANGDESGGITRIGRLARGGSSFRVDNAFIFAKPATPIRVIVASLPPAIITSASPY